MELQRLYRESGLTTAIIPFGEFRAMAIRAWQCARQDLSHARHSARTHDVTQRTRMHLARFVRLKIAA